MDASRNTIEKIIREKIIFNGLELEELGFELEDLTLEVPLFEENGIDLDSVDALEVLVGIQKEFEFRIPDIDNDFIKNKFKNIEMLIALCLEYINGNG